MHFCGPGWLVAIAYVDPGNYQSDIQAGASAKYNLIWTIFLVTLLSIYVQVLCSRLAVVRQSTLAESIRQCLRDHDYIRYALWVVAEFSIVITDLPEVIGIGIAFNVLFGWPYYAGCLISPVTTMLFLLLQNKKNGMRWLEAVIIVFIGVMSITIFVEWGLVGSNAAEIMKGWFTGYTNPEGRDLWAICGIVGAVVMPHNLYLHTASIQSRPVERKPSIIKQALFWTAIEPIFPIMFSFFINMAIACVAAATVYGEPGADSAGLIDMDEYLTSKAAKILWGLSLLAAGQSSAITTTYAGQYVMEGYIQLKMPIWARAVVTRLVALIPCVLVAALLEGQALNVMVNIVNSSLSVLLPFALTPLARFTTSKGFMGHYAAGRTESCLIWMGAFCVYAINAYSLSAPGGGFFGDIISGQVVTVGDAVIMVQNVLSMQMNIWMVIVQVVYLAFNAFFAFYPLHEHVREILIPRYDSNCDFGAVVTFD